MLYLKGVNTMKLSESKVDYPKVAIITGNWDADNKSISLTARKLVSIFLNISQEVTVISANHSINIEDSNLFQINLRCINTGRYFISRCFNHIKYQLKLVSVIFYLIKNQYNLFVFCFGADLFILPLLTLFIFRKKIIIRTDARPSVSLEYFHQPWWKVTMFKILDTINYSIADMILPEANYMIKYYHFERYSDKTAIGSLFVEDYFFDSKYIATNDRPYDIGYFGRFSKEKGFGELIESLKILGESQVRISVLFVGDGPLKDLLASISIYDSLNISVIPWCEKETIPYYLTRIKIFVLPSYKEGLPNSVLESMACGTPVLATAVGGIGDVIINGVSGFIILDNSPKEVALGIQKALNSDLDLDDIARIGREKIIQEYNYDVVQDKYRVILSNILNLKTSPIGHK